MGCFVFDFFVVDEHFLDLVWQEPPALTAFYGENRQYLYLISQFSVWYWAE